MSFARLTILSLGGLLIALLILEPSATKSGAIGGIFSFTAVAFLFIRSLEKVAGMRVELTAETLPAFMRFGHEYSAELLKENVIELQERYNYYMVRDCTPFPSSSSFLVRTPFELRLPKRFTPTKSDDKERPFNYYPLNCC